MAHKRLLSPRSQSMAHKRPRPAPPASSRRRLLLLLALASPLLLLASLHASSALLRHANSLGRRCMTLHPPAAAAAANRSSSPVKIAIVSFSDGGGGRRSFRGVMEAVGGNKRAYAEKMGYDFIDGHDLVDKSRPPSWSKILAVRSQLRSYDWVFWNDADTLVTNPEISLENILAAAIGHDDFHVSPDLVVTVDANGVNSGVFFVKRSKWSEEFLETWWNQTSFVQFGSTKSGDNDAMNYLIDGLSPEELRDHVRVSPMQCLFNSYPWFPTWKSTFRLISSPQRVWRGCYAKGDFMVHLAGIDNKKEWTANILQELKEERRERIYLKRAWIR